MTTKEYFRIQFNNKEFEVDSQKLIYILSCLESKEIKDKSHANIESLLEKYGLLDETFLDNINKI